MSIDNSFAVYILAFCAALLSLGMTAIAVILYKLTKKPKPKKPVIEVEYYDDKILEGWGFLVNGQIVLTSDSKPLLFPNVHVARECLLDRYNNQGLVVYQKWEPKTRQVKIGEVRSNGTNEFQKSESRARKTS